MANISSTAELCAYFPSILTRVFGRQDAASAGALGGGGGPGSLFGATSPDESSWMFGATSFYSPGEHLNGAPPHKLQHGTTRSNNCFTPYPRSAGRELRPSGMSPHGKRLLALLMARPQDQTYHGKNLFGILGEPQDVWYKFSCTNPPLPPQTLAALRFDPMAPSMVFENSRLYTHCLKKPPSVAPVNGVGMGGHLVRYGGMPPGSGGRGGAGPEPSLDVVPDLALTMMEYYLFSFAWYATSSAPNFYAGRGVGPGRVAPRFFGNAAYGTSSSWNDRSECMALGWRRFGVTGLLHRNPYLVLLRDYLEAFCPHNSDTLGGIAPGWELFLRVLMEFWLEGNAIRRAGGSNEVMREYGYPGQAEAPWLDPVSVEVVSDYVTPTDTSLHGLLVMSAHLLSDPLLRESCGRAMGIVSAGVDGGDVLGGDVSLLPPGLALIRPHVFSFLRTTFSSASSMDTGSSTFVLAVELWLLWLRPWTAPSILQGHSPLPAPGLGHARAQSLHGKGGYGRDARGATSGTTMTQLFGALLNSTSPSRGNAESVRRGKTYGAASQAPYVLSGAGAGSIASSGHFAPNPWAAWVLENYSFYTTLMAGFVRKAGNMSFRVFSAAEGVGSVGGGGPSGGVGVEMARRTQLDMGSGRANLELLWRVTDVFHEEVLDLVSKCQNTIAGVEPSLREMHPIPPPGTPSQDHPFRSRGPGELGSGSAGGRAAQSGRVNGSGTALSQRLSFTEELVLETGRKALCAVQGPRLVVLPMYKSAAQELLTSTAEHTNRRPPHGWPEKIMQKGRSGMDEVTRRAQASSERIRELFAISPEWRPRTNLESDSSSKARDGLTTMFRPEREEDNPAFLSERGREQLVTGQRVCRPWDAMYLGDPMYRPLGDWETRWSVDFWIGLSETLNGALPSLDQAPPGSEPELNNEHDGADGADEVSSPWTFPDEGPSRAIAKGKAFRERELRRGWRAKIPHRFNLRPLADLRAMLGLMVTLWVLMVAWSLNTTLGVFVAGLGTVLCIRLSWMDL